MEFIRLPVQAESCPGATRQSRAGASLRPAAQHQGAGGQRQEDEGVRGGEPDPFLSPPPKPGDRLLLGAALTCSPLMRERRCAPLAGLESLKIRNFLRTDPKSGLASEVRAGGL